MTDYFKCIISRLMTANLKKNNQPGFFKKIIPANELTLKNLPAIIYIAL